MNWAMEKLYEYISIDPDIRFGKPCIKGTRIAIVDILRWLSSGMNQSSIMMDYPELKEIHIKAALQFAANREEFTKMIAA